MASNKDIFTTQVGKKRGIPPLRIDSQQAKLPRNHIMETTTITPLPNTDSPKNQLNGDISLIKNGKSNVRPKSGLPQVRKHDYPEETSDLSKSLTTDTPEFTESFPSTSEKIEVKDDSSESNKSTSLGYSNLDPDNLRPIPSALHSKKKIRSEKIKKKIKEKCLMIMKENEVSDNQEFPPIVLDDFKTKSVLAKVTIKLFRLKTLKKLFSNFNNFYILE